MRSITRDDPGQLGLWDEPASVDVRRSSKRAREELLSFEVTTGAFASRGWFIGTILYYTPAARAERGQTVVVQRGEDVRAGEYDVVWGRPVIRTDSGSFWMGPDWALVGVVRMVESPLLDVDVAVAG